MREGAPLWQQIALDVLVPPIGTLMWLVTSRRRASAVHGGKVSETTKKRQARMAIVLLVLVYALMFGITIYARLT